MGFYDSSEYQDELGWGAIWLYKATKAAGAVNASYLSDAQNYYSGWELTSAPTQTWTQSWGDKSYGGMVLMAQELPSNSHYKTVEGINGNPTQSLITVSLNKASSQAISVNYATSNGTAIAGTDYTATTGTLIFAAGQTSRTIAVPILNNNLNEINETFRINLTAPTNATISDSQSIVTIADTLVSSVTTILPTLVENLTLTGTSAINATGNAGNNVLTGNAANNSYLYDADLAQGKDTINETTTGGIDALNLSQTAAAVNINLGLTTAQTVNANLQLVIPVIALENIVGGAGNDRITGNILANNLQGGSGDDRISGLLQSKWCYCWVRYQWW